MGKKVIRSERAALFLCAGAFLLAFLSNEPAPAQTTPSPSTVLLKIGRLLDLKSGTYLPDQAVLVVGERIKEVGRFTVEQAHAPKDARLIDLSRAVVLPGLIDAHTHLMARISSITPEGYALNLLTKSQAFRALEGAADARLTLRAGFTTVRDVESEGSQYADVALRDAIDQGLVEGPRMAVATRGIAALGRYFPFGISPDLHDFPTGAQMISGVDEARRAAREQISHGANLLKVYADWRSPTLTLEELRVIVEEAHSAGLPVAAHADSPRGIQNAVMAGVDSIEHGTNGDRAALEAMKEKGVFLVPTVGGLFDENLTSSLESAKNVIRMALELHVKLANGYDAATAEAHGRNANELVSMVKLGLTPIDAIRAATIGAAELMRWQDRVGSVEPGRFADLIALTGDPLDDITQLQHVAFVMKGGVVVKNELRY
jgi:imidazolonepropionase-like amidohydrolase